MADIEKRLNKAAMIKASAWGTETQTNVALMGITPLNQGIPVLAYPSIEIDETCNANQTDIDFANFGVSDFTLDFNYNYDGLENVLLAMLMGTAGAPSTPGGSARLHTLVMNDSASGIFGTYAVEKGAKIHVVPSFKVMKATFGLNGGLIKSSFGLRGSKVTDASAVITAFSSVTYAAIHNSTRAKYHQAAFRMNAQGGAALDTVDIINPKSFTLEIERQFDTEHASGSQQIIEPRETGKPIVRLTMEFPRMDTTNDDYFAAWTAQTEKKFDLTITGPVISTIYTYYLKFQMPRLIIENVEYADAGIIPCKIVARAVVADSAPTGMTALTKPVTITLTNTRTTDLLA